MATRKRERRSIVKTRAGRKARDAGASRPRAAGAATVRFTASDPEWKDEKVRKLLMSIERAIAKGIQFAVFEPNGDALWARVRGTVESYLLAVWRAGKLQGTRPQEAFFVRCDRTTMTQDDLDNGRLVCVVGVSPLRPAEFVVFRIGQWTAEKK